MGVEDVSRDLGRHDAEIIGLKEDIAKLASSVEKLGQQLADVQTTLTEAKGGWRVLMMIGGAAGALSITLRDMIEPLFRPH